MRVMVTGAGGYIGTVLVPLLLLAGHQVLAIDRFFFGRELLADARGLTIVTADTRRLTAVHFIGIDAVIDLAAISNDPSGERFKDATLAINWHARARNAGLAKAAGVGRYVLPSSCSIYGLQAGEGGLDEDGPTNPLTTYAKANLAAENAILPLADERFCVVVLRQATVFGLSGRMRFDLAINGMTFGAWQTGRLPVMRDGTQWRPMVHVGDTASANMFMLTVDPALVNGRIFNVGSAENVYQLAALGQLVADLVPRPVELAWYGDPDPRSYRVSFARIERLGWRATKTAADGVAELCQALETGRTTKSPKTITLEWYQLLAEWQAIVHATELDGAMLDL